MCIFNSEGIGLVEWKSCVTHYLFGIFKDDMRDLSWSQFNSEVMRQPDSFQWDKYKASLIDWNGI